MFNPKYIILHFIKLFAAPFLKVQSTFSPLGLTLALDSFHKLTNLFPSVYSLFQIYSSFSSKSTSGKSHSCIQLYVTLCTIAHQSPLSLGFSRQEYWTGLPCPPPGDLPNPGSNPCLTCSCIGRRTLLPLGIPEKPPL